jgi:hypothetical protein
MLVKYSETLPWVAWTFCAAWVACAAVAAWVPSRRLTGVVLAYGTSAEQAVTAATGIMEREL